MSTQTLNGELRELDTRAADLQDQAAAADKTARAAADALALGTGSARDAADARNTQDAIKDALSTVNARRVAVRAQLEQIAADARARAIEMQAVGAAQRAGAHRRQVEAAALEAVAALQRFADTARPALDAHTNEQRAFIAQAHEMTAGDPTSSNTWIMDLNATYSRLRELGADETQAPDLKTLPFGALLVEALKSNAPRVAYVNAAAPAVQLVPNGVPNPTAAPPLVLWPSR